MPKKKAKLPLSKTHPKLAKEAVGWDPSKFTFGSSKKMLWKCARSHEWEAAIGSRATRNFGCPYCSNQSVLVGYNDFATTHPELLCELLNSNGTDFVAGSTTKNIEWKCNLGHQFKMKPQERTVRDYGCPVCSGRQVLAGFNDLATTYPQIAVEAYKFDATTVTAGSNVNMEWKCSYGHIFKAPPHQRTTRSSGCAVCNGNQINIGVNDLESTDPELALEAYNWDPKTLTRSSNKQRDWKCGFGHIWTTSLNSRTNMKSGCPVCGGRKLLIGFNDLATLFPSVAAEADGWDPNYVLSGTHKKYSWICNNGHKWKSVLKDRTSRGDGCPSCAIYGFNPNIDGYLYFISHPDWEMFQIGITNHPKDRLKTHEILGWQLLELRGPIGGHLTQQWETAILRMLKAKGADLSNEKIAGKFEGYSEAWSRSTFSVQSIKELMRLTEEFEENK